MSQLDEAWRTRILSGRDTSNAKGYYSEERRAQLYDASALIWEDAYRRVCDLSPNPSWSVLEIGPGPGVMTIPLAQRVKSVTTIEIAEPMVTLLRRHLTEEGINNVRIIHENWEETDPNIVGEHDLVLASYCLDMPEIRSALMKMCSLARKAVHLWWFEGLTSWEQIRIELMPDKIATDWSGFPKSDLLMKILSDMGYDPVYEELSGTSFPKVFTSLDKAYERMADMLRLDTRTPISPEVKSYINTHWLRQDGTYEYRDTTRYVHITVPIEKSV